MNAKIKKSIDIILPLGISAALVVWLFRKVDISQIRDALSGGDRWGWMFVMMGVLILSHVIRGIRWGMQLRAAGIPRIPVMTESVSIFGAYALNLVFSYLGEAWRCVYISRLADAKISTVVGTDLGDRASDALTVLLLIVLTLFVARPAMEGFMNHYDFGRSIMAALGDGALWGWIAGVIALIAILLWVGRKSAWMAKVRNAVKRIWGGFAVLFHMKGIDIYLLLTVGIWTCYFLETYICFQVFPFTRQLVTSPGMAWGLIPGLVVFVFGSCSIAIPSSGGLGPWNIAVMFALTLYGVPQAEGAAYSLVVWCFESGTLVLLGLFSAAYVALQRKYGFGLPIKTGSKNGREQSRQGA
ncbi:MAG: flippase-like domain-containing protein [Bacteroides sp.]|nr:flippase-like domain-containing protein [Bacteroides sp.]